MLPSDGGSKLCNCITLLLVSLQLHISYISWMVLDSSITAIIMWVKLGKKSVCWHAWKYIFENAVGGLDRIRNLIMFFEAFCCLYLINIRHKKSFMKLMCPKMCSDKYYAGLCSATSNSILDRAIDLEEQQHNDILRLVRISQGSLHRGHSL